MKMKSGKRAGVHSPSSVGSAERACGYARVSTTRQADGELSLPDQQKQIVPYCGQRGWELVAEYTDAGVTGTVDDREEFQRMIERATDDDHPYDVIVIHSLSRFFRDSFQVEMYFRKLAKVGVRIASVTQDLGDDPAQIMMRQIM